MPIKQVIVMRKDLRMRRGKEISQGSHSAISFLTRNLKRVAGEEGLFQIQLSKAEVEWISGEDFTKITCQVNSEDELLDLHEAAKKAGLKSYLIKDAGKTEFGGKKTLTCLAIGPDEAEKIDPITGKLELY